jgi:hypothetical protein
LTNMKMSTWQMNVASVGTQIAQVEAHVAQVETQVAKVETLAARMEAQLVKLMIGGLAGIAIAALGAMASVAKFFA